MTSIYPIYNTDLRYTLGALQLLQAALSRGEEMGRKEPTLTDVSSWLIRLQQHFGDQMDLETIIQRYYAQDLREQWAQRHPEPDTTPVVLSHG